MIKEPNASSVIEADVGCLYQTDDEGEAMVPLRVKEGLKHPISLNRGDLLVEIDPVDAGDFCALKDLEQRQAGRQLEGRWRTRQVKEQER